MFDLTLTDEQNALVQTAREFAREKIAPVAGHLDEEGKFPTEIMNQAFALGLMNFEIPEAFGGLGLSCLTHSIIMEEIAWACAGVNTTLAANMLASMPLIIAGTDGEMADRELMQRRREAMLFGRRDVKVYRLP